METNRQFAVVILIILLVGMLLWTGCSRTAFSLDDTGSSNLTDQYDSAGSRGASEVVDEMGEEDRPVDHPGAGEKKK